MQAFLSFLVFVILFATVQSWYGNNFNDFKTCLIKGGIDSDNIIVKRNNSKIYENLNFHWQLKPPNILPLAFVLPASPDDVEAAVVCGRRSNIRVVPKSGGHSFEKYSFGNNNSVVLDLRNLNSVIMNNSTSTATIGSGALAGKIAITLWNDGRSYFPIGSCPTVGITGLATGGGYGYLSRTFGLTTDYILGATIVTSNGRKIQVNNFTNSDLYWALRGGGATSFGIVTEFTFKVIPAPRTVFFAMVTWNLDAFIQVFQTFQLFTLNGPRAVTAKMNIANRTVEITFVDSTGEGRNFETILRSFPSAKTISRASYDYPDFVVVAAGGDIKRPIDSQGLLRINTMSTEPSYQVMKSFYVEKMATEVEIRSLQFFLNKLPDTVSVAFQAYGGAIDDLSPSETAFVHRKGRFALGAVYNHPNPGNDFELSRNIWLEEFFELGKIIFNQRESYQNYADGKLLDYLQQYYGTNLQRLVQIKQKHDPQNYFHSPQSIPPCLPYRV